MRIFNLDTILSFALYPEGSKKRNRNSQGYCLNVDQYSKNGCDETDNGTLKKHLKNLKVLCLGVLAVESENIIPNEVAFVKFQVEKKKQYKVKKEFQSPNENIPLPLFLFYKKKKTKFIKALKALTDILNPPFFEIIGLHKKKNLDLKKLEMSKEDIIKINSDYQIKVTAIAEKIFNEIEVSRPDIVITGIFADPYFIRKADGKLFLEDTRPSDTLPRRNSPSYETSLLNDSDSYKSMESEAESCDSNTLSNDSSKSDISASLELSPFEFIEDLPKNLSVTESASVIDVVGAVQLHAEVDMLNNTVGLTVIPQAEEKIIASIHTNQSSIPRQDKLDDWNAETKKNITTLLLAYQKHLTKKYFFRSNDHITNSKKYITADLLDKLNDSPENCYNHAYGISTANILNKHRDITIIQKIGKFFKRHNKTEGTLLLENIFSMLENNPVRNTQSV